MEVLHECINCSSICLQHQHDFSESFKISRNNNVKFEMCKLFKNQLELQSKKVPNVAEMCRMCYSVFNNFCISRDNFLSRRSPHSKISKIVGQCDEGKPEVRNVHENGIIAPKREEKCSGKVTDSNYYQKSKEIQFQNKFVQIKSENCNMDTCDNSELSENSVLVHGNVRYLCHICNKKFLEYSTCQMHIKNHQNNDLQTEIEMGSSLKYNGQLTSQSQLKNPENGRTERRGRKPGYSGRLPVDKKVLKKEQNRTAASKYRERKKKEIRSFLKQEQEYQSVLDELTKRKEDLQREISIVKQLLRDVVNRNKRRGHGSASVATIGEDCFL